MHTEINGREPLTVTTGYLWKEECVWRCGGEARVKDNVPFYTIYLYL